MLKKIFFIKKNYTRADGQMSDKANLTDATGGIWMLSVKLFQLPPLLKVWHKRSLWSCCTILFI